MTVEQVDAGAYWAGGAGIQGNGGSDGNWLVGWDGVGVVECEEGNLA